MAGDREGDKPPHRRWLEPVVVAAVALAFAAPLALTVYFPGLDLPWHAAIIEILHRHSGDAVGHDFLGYFAVGRGLSSLITLYTSVDYLAFVTGDVAIAMQIVIAAYVVLFVWAARSLVRAFGGSGYVAVLAAPAAYSVTMQFGFLSYALAYPMTLWLWSLTRQLMIGRPPVWRAVAVLAVSALIALTHPFATLVALIGGGLLVAVHTERATARRAAVAAGGMLIGVVPAALAVAAVGGDSNQVSPALQQMGLWDKIMAQQFTPVLEALAASPVRLFGFVPELWCFALVVLAFGSAVLARTVGGAPPADDANTMRGRAALWLVAVLGIVYLITPYSFEWPRFWFAVQPRILPLVWCAALVLVRVRPDPDRIGHTLAGPLAVCALALAVLVTTALWPFASEANDFRSVMSHIPTRSRTLALIDQPRAGHRSPASPFRHFGAYVVVDRGGYTAGLPISKPKAGNAGILVPVRLADDAPPLPAAPVHGQSWTFDWPRHGPGWDYFLIRDRDPDAPFDYFREYADRVELVDSAGRWRLYRAGER